MRRLGDVIEFEFLDRWYLGILINIEPRITLYQYRVRFVTPWTEEHTYYNCTREMIRDVI